MMSRLRSLVLKARNCVECGEPIPAKRLKIVPDAKHCIECLELLEEDGKGTKRSTGHYDAQLQGHRMESIEFVIVKK